VRDLISPRSAWSAKAGPLQSLSGAAYDGSRLSKLYAEDVEDAGIVSTLDRFSRPMRRRQKGERFAISPSAPALVAATTNGADFHNNTGAKRAK